MAARRCSSRPVGCVGNGLRQGWGRALHVAGWKKPCSIKRWSQSGLAKRMDLLPQHVSNWKTRGVPPERYEAIADALDCSIDELLGRMKYVASAGAIPPPWLFKGVDEAKVRPLDEAKLNQLEAGMILSAA